MKKSTQKLRLSRETLRQLLLTKAVGGYYSQVPCTHLKCGVTDGVPCTSPNCTGATCN